MGETQKMKKFLSLILSCTMCMTVAVASGCKDKDSTGSTPTQIVEQLELEDSYKLLTLGDRVELPVSYNRLEGETLSWSSSSPSVVSVDGNGFVEALKVGTATVTVRYGTKQASCKVEVGLSRNVPTFDFDVNEDELISLSMGTAIDLGARVQFNGKSFDDGAIEYYVSDPSIGEVVDGKFVAKNTLGSATISVIGTWRGQTVHTKNISVKVVSENTVLLNGGRLTEVELYMAAEHEGISYPTAQTISSVYVSENNTEIADYRLSVVDEAIATIVRSGNEWTIQPQKAGKTQLVVSYGEKEFPFDVTVIRPVSDIAKTVEYSLADGMYFDESSASFKGLNQLVNGFDTIVSYELGGKEVKAKDGKVDISAGMGQLITLYSENVGYRMTVDAYTMIVDELKDFEKIYAAPQKTEVGGRYMLAKDIIEPDTVLSMPAGMVANNFAGYFDGKGHVISFTLDHGATARFGLFGEFLNGATIKNLAFSNVKKTGTTAKNPAGIICYEGVPAGSTKISTLENLFVDVSFVSPSAAHMVFMHNASWTTALKHVIIHAPEVPAGDPYGSFARGACVSVSNSYIISSAPRFSDSGTKPENIKGWEKMQPVLYASYDEMKGKNDYSSFSPEFWDTSKGYPVWKSLA